MVKKLRLTVVSHEYCDNHTTTVLVRKLYCNRIVFITTDIKSKKKYADLDYKWTDHRRLLLVPKLTCTTPKHFIKSN